MQAPVLVSIWQINIKGFPGRLQIRPLLKVLGGLFSGKKKTGRGGIRYVGSDSGQAVFSFSVLHPFCLAQVDAGSWGGQESYRSESRGWELGCCLERVSDCGLLSTLFSIQGPWWLSSQFWMLEAISGMVGKSQTPMSKHWHHWVGVFHVFTLQKWRECLLHLCTQGSQRCRSWLITSWGDPTLTPGFSV